MAHQVIQMASTQREWHHAMTDHAILPEGAGMAVWLEHSGMDFEIVESTVRYEMEREGYASQYANFPQHKVLYRSDNGQPISVVGHGYQVHQPREILGFFRDLADDLGYSIQSAGVLKNSAVYWALAKIPDSGIAVPGDRSITESYVLLCTSADGSLSTTGQLTSVRVVCANTLHFALSRYGKGCRVKVSHKSSFDGSAMKRALGLAADSYDNIFSQFQSDMARLVETPISSDQAAQYFKDLLQPPKANSAEIATPRANLGAESFADLMSSPAGIGQSGAAQYSLPAKSDDRAPRGFDALMDAWRYSPGQAGVKDSAYGLLQGTTHYIDHVRNADGKNREWSAMYGQGAALKERALENALMLADQA